jgi:hypothetical protein
MIAGMLSLSILKFVTGLISGGVTPEAMLVCPNFSFYV